MRASGRSRGTSVRCRPRRRGVGRRRGAVRRLRRGSRGKRRCRQGGGRPARQGRRQRQGRRRVRRAGRPGRAEADTGLGYLGRVAARPQDGPESGRCRRSADSSGARAGAAAGPRPGRLGRLAGSEPTRSSVRSAGAPLGRAGPDAGRRRGVAGRQDRLAAPRVHARPAAAAALERDACALGLSLPAEAAVPECSARTAAARRRGEPQPARAGSSPARSMPVASPAPRPERPRAGWPARRLPRRREPAPRSFSRVGPARPARPVRRPWTAPERRPRELQAQARSRQWPQVRQPVRTSTRVSRL